MKMKFAPMVTVIAAMLAGAGIATTSAISAPLRHDGLVRDFHGRDFRALSLGERQRWFGGHWIHDWHGGRYGWWWSVGPYWYFYNQPIYPYPYYIPPLVEAEPPALPPVAGPATWYYCENPQGYYPTVGMCNVPWRAVPAVPPTAVPPAG